MNSLCTVFLLFAVFASAKHCQPHEEFRSDCGNRCFEACGSDEFTACPKACETGYFCQKGYKRHHNGTCVLAKDCPCPRNEIWADCGSGCGDNCGSENNKICPAVCKIGCICKKGYSRDVTGHCIPSENCPNRLKCGKNEEKIKLNRCAESCFAKNCSDERFEGCFCKSGFARNLNGECVPRKFCPKEPVCANSYEIFKPDGSPCQDHCDKAIRRCADDRQPGCFCIEGFARDWENGLCRPYLPNNKGILTCGEMCGKNAEWSQCTSSCDNECDFVVGLRRCMINHIRCPDDCRCKKGFARKYQRHNSESCYISLSPCTDVLVVRTNNGPIVAIPARKIVSTVATRIASKNAKLGIFVKPDSSDMRMELVSMRRVASAKIPIWNGMTVQVLVAMDVP
ncbi:SCO-spondin-like [Culicoides brevitarsis]|uniref:SCO-spondin-like n=1 Tax=Culicoides brevitarsis TaxID=469753 RepID=UPI00307C40A6